MKLETVVLDSKAKGLVTNKDICTL